MRLTLNSAPEPVPYGPGLAIWRSFTATYEPESEGSAWPIVVLDFRVVDGRAELQEITLRRRPNTPLQPSLRLPLGQLARAAVEAAVLEVRPAAGGAVKLIPAGDRGTKDAVVQMRRQQPGRRRTWSDADARQVLRLYEKAKKDGVKNPLQVVADQVHRSKSLTHVMLAHAREEREVRRGRSRRAKK